MLIIFSLKCAALWTSLFHSELGLKPWRHQWRLLCFQNGAMSKARQFCTGNTPPCFTSQFLKFISFSTRVWLLTPHCVFTRPNNIPESNDPYWSNFPFHFAPFRIFLRLEYIYILMDCVCVCVYSLICFQSPYNKMQFAFCFHLSTLSYNFLTDTLALTYPMNLSASFPSFAHFHIVHLVQPWLHSLIKAQVLHVQEGLS